MQQGENFLKSADFRITKIKIRVKSKAPVKAGKEQGLKVPRMVIVSGQPWP